MISFCYRAAVGKPKWLVDNHKALWVHIGDVAGAREADCSGTPEEGGQCRQGHQAQGLNISSLLVQAQQFSCFGTQVLYEEQPIISSAAIC